MPCRDQSRQRQVRPWMSKISTPCMALTMAALEAWKASSSGNHKNFQRELRNGLKGAIMSRSWAYM